MKKLLLGMLLLPGFIVAQGRMTPELLWKLGRVSGGAVSPDGKHVLYGVTYYDIQANKGNRDLYLVPMAGGEIKKITDYKGSEFNETWSKDGKVLFLSAQTGAPQIWQYDLTTGKQEQISDVAGGMNGFILSDDGKMLVYIQDVKLDQSLNDKYPDLPQAHAFATDYLMYRHWTQWHDYAFSHVFYSTRNDASVFRPGKDIMTGERFDSPLNPFGGIEQIALSHDKKTIVYTSKKLNGAAAAKSTNSDLYLYDIASEKTTDITSENKGYDQNPAFSPDGKTLAYQSMKHDGFEADKNDIILYDLATGNKKNITTSFDLTTGNFIWSQDGKFIYTTIPTIGTEQIHEINLASGKMRQISQGDFDFAVVSQYGKELVCTKMHMNAPNEIYKIELKSLKETPLTFTNKEAYATIKTGKVEKRWITTSDNKKMLTWVIYPPDFDPNKKYPTLLYCQGGPTKYGESVFLFPLEFPDHGGK